MRRPRVSCAPTFEPWLRHRSNDSGYDSIVDDDQSVNNNDKEEEEYDDGDDDDDDDDDDNAGDKVQRTRQQR